MSSLFSVLCIDGLFCPQNHDMVVNTGCNKCNKYLWTLNGPLNTKLSCDLALKLLILKQFLEGILRPNSPKKKITE